MRVYECTYDRNYNSYPPPSNLTYDGDRFKANVNMTTTGTLCFVGGCIVGAAIAYYLLKNLDNNK